MDEQSDWSSDAVTQPIGDEVKTEIAEQEVQEEKPLEDNICLSSSSVTEGEQEIMGEDKTSLTCIRPETLPEDLLEPEEETQKENRVLDTLSGVDEKIKALLAEVTKLGVDVVSLQKTIVGYYTQTTDSMHREIEKYRKGLLRKMDQELFGELIELYDAVGSAIEKAKQDSSLALPLLEGIHDQIDAALYNRGIEKREALHGEKFDPRRHHITKPDMPTGEQSLNGTVAATVKAGFDDMDESFKDLRDGCMKLRPVWVRVYRYDEALASTAEAQPQQPEESESQENSDLDNQ